MKTEIIEKLALMYTQANIEMGQSPTDVLALYKRALAAMQKNETDTLDKAILSDDWGL